MLTGWNWPRWPPQMQRCRRAEAFVGVWNTLPSPCPRQLWHCLNGHGTHIAPTLRTVLPTVVCGIDAGLSAMQLVTYSRPSAVHTHTGASAADPSRASSFERSRVESQWLNATMCAKTLQPISTTHPEPPLTVDQCSSQSTEAMKLSLLWQHWVQVGPTGLYRNVDGRGKINGMTLDLKFQ
ncbi:hypothetical protein IQ06DRAFT_94583 [Phaeosphaeriaceae sp. SRC1lsM3a]|nr:hypothetical protein IQ06DRAFT_94583 [Stagonospora sp. SRC1lsM3a]